MAARKRIAERLIENIDDLPELGRSNRNLALFLGLKDEIEEALRIGWNIKCIWRMLYKEKKFLGSYYCFRFYIKKYIKDCQVFQCNQIQEPKKEVSKEFKEILDNSITQSLHKNTTSKIDCTTKCFNPPKKISPNDLY